MDSVVGSSFLSAPLRSPSAVEGLALGVDLAALDQCWESLTSKDPIHRAAALTTISHYRSRTFYRHVVADPKGWSDTGARILYRSGFETLELDGVRRLEILRAIASDLAEARGIRASMLYSVFHAVLRPDLDPGPPRALVDREQVVESVARTLALIEECSKKALALHEDQQPEVPSASEVDPGDAEPIELLPTITAPRSAKLARCLIVALSEVTALWSIALGAHGGPRAQSRALRQGLGLTSAELASALRGLGARLFELGRSIAAGERAPMGLAHLWSATVELGPVALPRDLPEAQRLVASTRALCPWWRSIPTDNEVALAMLFEHPLWASLTDVIHRRAQRFEVPGSAAEAQVAAALALAQGLGGMPPLEGAIERAIANAAGIIVPWSARPRNDRDLRWLRAEWQPTLARAFANADFTGWRYETWQSAELVLNSWAIQEPIRLGLGSWAVIGILGAGAISYFVILLTSILGAAG